MLRTPDDEAVDTHELLCGVVEALAQMAAAMLVSGACKPDVLLAMMEGCLEGQATAAQTAHLPSRQMAAAYVADMIRAGAANPAMRQRSTAPMVVN